MQLVIGTKSWSTWSLRPWLVLKRTGQPFEERLIRLRWDGAADSIRSVSASGKVPVLRDGDETIWDSLAICEYLAERFPEARLWPADPVARAIARAVTAEMHSSFQALRSTCPMDLALRTTAELDAATTADVRRIVTLWLETRRRFGDSGPWLFGDWSIADAFYTPVATRFRTYGIDLAAHGDDGTDAAYLMTLLSDPDFLSWEADALAEDPEPAVGAAKL
jgi:glutathione S-transferase